MKTKLLAAAGAAALVMGGVAIERADSGAPFIDPSLLAESMCGGAGGSQAKSRAFFARIGAAMAKEAAPIAQSGAPQKFGDIAYPVTTSAALAQAHFNAGLAYMLNFNHGAAIASFRAAQGADPDCAMCWWGESIAHGPNINAPMADEAVAPAYAALKKALGAKSASEKERMLIEALAKRYAPAPVKDRAKLDAGFADAMAKVAAQYPGDDLILALSAEADMDASPWDYWEADARTPKGRTAHAIGLIETVLKRNPNHPAAIHLYIHLTEATTDPFRAVPYADRLAGVAPGLGHLIHMPAHTYFRIGRYRQSLKLNVEASAADEAFLAANKAEPMYEYGYYVHNIHFVLTSAQMAGDAKTALAMAAKLDNKLPLQFASEVPFAQPIKVAPYYAMAQFADPAVILETEDPGVEVPFVAAAWRYARGEAYARLGEAGKAREEARAIGKLLAEEDFSPLLEINIPATDILRIQQLTIEARAAGAEGKRAEAVEIMEEVVAKQDALPYTEPAYWYYPARQTLAAMVLADGDAERAQQLFIEALAEAPNSGRALFGLAEANLKAGDKAGAKYARALLKRAWSGEAKLLSLASL
ncbi:MAG: hypothetical protein ABL957_07585 [Parvularculaceae bacterium]